PLGDAHTWSRYRSYNDHFLSMLSYRRTDMLANASRKYASAARLMRVVMLGLLATHFAPTHGTSAAALSAAEPDSDKATQPPNFVFIIADDLTFRDIGCYGGQAQTPNIDRLATEGMQFLNCFQTAPMCSPTRHNIYTGLYPVKSGAHPNHTFVEPKTKSIVQYLKPLGYRVALSGKTHIGPKTVFDFEYSAKQKNPDLDVIETLFTDCKTEGTPFCLFACSNEPHTPWNKGDASEYPPADIVLPPYIADTEVVREEFSRYLAEITYFDSQVGDILEKLDAAGLRKNTLVVVVSEQGNSMPFAKWTCYDHGLQSAMIVRWPGKVLPGSKSNAIVEYADITPTFVQAAGGETDANWDGKSFVDILTGKSTFHKQYSYGLMTTRGINSGSEYYAIRSIRDKRYRLIWNPHHQATFENACTTSKGFQSMVKAAAQGDDAAAQIVQRYQHRPEYELYDCEADPMQLQNLAASETLTDVRERLQTELERWMKQQGDDALETERNALTRLARYQGLSVEAANAKHAKTSKPKRTTKKSSKPFSKKNKARQ
ncbi:MAG: sulfatase, partial [Pirellulaceae bacterium]